MTDRARHAALAETLVSKLDEQYVFMARDLAKGRRRESPAAIVARVLAQEEPPPPPERQCVSAQPRARGTQVTERLIVDLQARADAAEARLRQLEEERDDLRTKLVDAEASRCTHYGGALFSYSRELEARTLAQAKLTAIQAAHGRLRTALDSIGDRIGRIQNAARRIDDRRELRGMNYSDMTIIQGEAELIARELSQAALIPSPEEPHA